MILQRILEDVQARMRERIRERPLSVVERAAGEAPATRGFASAVTAAAGIGLIAELKRASPSAGVLRDEFDVGKLAASYARGGANALSVLTEADHFKGSLANLQAAAACGLPRLQKDFLLHEYQVLEARAAGADAVLLIAEVLDEARSEQMLALALDLGMDVLFESHQPALLQRVSRLAERVPERIFVGINNRDLRTFEVSLDVTLSALEELPAELGVVSESGIHSAEDVRRLHAAGVRGILVGESLMRQEDVEAATRDLLRLVR